MTDTSEAYEVLRGLINESPFYKYMDLEVVEAGEGRSRLLMKVKPEMLNLFGICHGGAIATIMDSSFAIALGTTLEEGKVLVTVDMRINYISTVNSGELVGEGRVIHRGTQTAVVSAEVRNGSGELVAVGMSTYLICSPADLRQADYQDQ